MRYLATFFVLGALATAPSSANAYPEGWSTATNCVVTSVTEAGAYLVIDSDNVPFPRTIMVFPRYTFNCDAGTVHVHIEDADKMLGAALFSSLNGGSVFKEIVYHSKYGNYNTGCYLIDDPDLKVSCEIALEFEPITLGDPAYILHGYRL